MADLVADANELRVCLSRRERIGVIPLRDEVRIPLSGITAVRVSQDPWSELRGIRVGTGLPRVICLGTTRGEGFRDFVAVYRSKPAVVVECSNAPFQRLVISRDDAEAKARMVQTALQAVQRR